MTPIRVLIAEDAPVVSAALTGLLAADPRVDLVDAVSTTAAAVARTRALQPDVVVFDMKMPGGGGITGAREICDTVPGTKIVAFSAYQDRHSILGMLNAGAVGYVTKGGPPGELMAAIQTAARGGALLSSGASAELVHELAVRLRVEEQEALLHEQRMKRLTAAIAGDLRIVYQPIVNLATGCAAGVEALARFNGDPAATPDVWFAEAAQLGMQVPLERTAFLAALAALDELPMHLFLSLNLSPASIVSAGFWDGLSHEVARRLVLEITEHAAIEDYEALQGVLGPLRSSGMRIAVDDVGAGYASLRHVLLLRPDFIKIDATLTRQLARHPTRYALTTALIDFAARSGSDTISEGIENHADRRILKEAGSTFGQGYLLGRPAPLRELHLAGGYPDPCAEAEVA